MLLRASGQAGGDALDARAVTEDAAAAGSGVAHAEALLAFADAAVQGDDATLAEARDRVCRELGPEELVDAAAVVGNFERMVRIADSTGIPLDGPLNAMSVDLRSELGIDAFGSAANSPETGVFARMLGRVLQPLLPRVARLAMRANRD